VRISRQISGQVCKGVPKRVGGVFVGKFERKVWVCHVDSGDKRQPDS
jgi:hypothetical protein